MVVVPGLVVVLLVGVMFNYMAYIGSNGVRAYDVMYCDPLVRILAVWGMILESDGGIKNAKRMEWIERMNGRMEWTKIIFWFKFYETITHQLAFII